MANTVGESTPPSATVAGWCSRAPCRGRRLIPNRQTPETDIQQRFRTSCEWCGADINHGTFARFPHRHIGVIMLETLELTPPSPTTGAGAQKPKVRPSPEMDAARRRVRQRIREYELSWLLQQRAALACNVLTSWPHWRLR